MTFLLLTIFCTILVDRLLPYLYATKKGKPGNSFLKANWEMGGDVGGGCVYLMLEILFGIFIAFVIHAGLGL